MSRLERGERRTRRSTLTRVAAVFVVEVPKLGPVERLVDDLVHEAGPALAEQSAHAERVGRRLAKRMETAHKMDERKDEVRLLRLLYEEEYGPRRWLRTPAEMEARREVMWGYFYERRAHLSAKRRQVEQLFSSEP